tara:strand:+ start:561 stop:695 length:135 start_codon:yes stop_codon:yes gene_type:complete
MKTPLTIIEEMVDKYSDDKELGQRIRAYIGWLRDLLKGEEDENS